MSKLFVGGSASLFLIIIGVFKHQHFQSGGDAAAPGAAG